MTTSARPGGDGALLAGVDRALAARDRLRTRAVRETAAALAAAARRWAADAAWRAELPDEAGLSPANVAAAVEIAAAALDTGAMEALHDAEGRDGAAPALVAEILPSNVPALALPAIALGCLAGAAVLVKSGRADRRSAPAFHAALAAVDPDLAATVIPARWERDDPGADAALARADVVVASGGDAAMRALRTRLGVRLVTHGSRTSVAVVAGAPRADVAAALARDVALHDQRGCLSPATVWVAGDAHAWAAALVAALRDVAAELPPGPATLATRAAVRIALAAAEFGGAYVAAGPWGAVVTGGTLAPPGGRTLHVRPLHDVDALPDRLESVECVGVAGTELDPEALRAAGVARLCPVGRMQRPPLAWPRGQRAPLGSLRGCPGLPRILVEAP